jgi:hypothetical protein
MTSMQDELRLLRVAVDNHTDRLSEVEDKLDILIDGQAEIMRLIRARGL